MVMFRSIVAAVIIMAGICSASAADKVPYNTTPYAKPHEAQMVFGKIGTIAPTNPCALFLVDNNCSTRASGINTGRVPGFQEPTAIADSAGSGQLPVTSDPNYAADLATRTAYFRKDGVYIPCVDGPCGSQDPTDSGTGNPGALTPIYLLNVDPNRGGCTYYPFNNSSPANPNTPVPAASPTLPNFVYCIATGNNQTSTIQNYDLSNTGSGTGTDMVPVWVQPNSGFTNTTLQLLNVYIKCSNSWCIHSGGVGVVCPCLLNGNKPGGGRSFDNVIETNVTVDGDVFTILNSGAVTLSPLVFNFHDMRYDPTQGNYNTTISNSILMHSGHVFYTGLAGGTLTFNGDMADRTCISGFTGCHGEMAEAGQITGYRPTLTVVYNGVVWWQGQWGPSTQLMYGEFTAPIYMTSGGANGLILTGTVKNSFFFMNNGSCGNNPAPGNLPYSPNNTCGTPWQSAGNSAFIATLWSPYIQSLTLQNIYVDPTGAQACYANEFGSGVPGLITVGFGGTTMTISTAPASNPLSSNNIKFPFALWPGNGIIDATGGLGFVATHTLPPGSQTGTSNPFASFTATMAVAGTMTTAVSQNLEVGQSIFITGISVGFVSGGSVGSTVSGTSFSLVTTSGGATPVSTTFATTQVQSYNDTSSAIPGANPVVGTYDLADSEPTIAPSLTNRFQAYAWIQSSSLSNITIGGRLTDPSTGTVMTMSDLLQPSIGHEDSCR